MKDGVLAAGLTLMGFVPTLSTIGAQLADLPKRPADALAVVLTVAQAVPLVARSRWPAACLMVVGAAFALHQALSYPQTFASIGLYLALYAAGAHQVRYRRGLMALMTAGYVVLTVVLVGLGSPNRAPDFFAFYLALVVCRLTGGGLRRWRAEEAERRRLGAEVAMAAERARIARELHDVVTHHVTAMVVQADAARYVGGEAGGGLAAISDTGRRALTELRHLLGVLEATGESAVAHRAPTLSGVGEIVEQARLSGQPVELTEHGDRRPRGADVELAAYRVVQEALTNAIKHAAGQPTTVTVRHHDDHLEIEVTNDGPTDALPRVPSGGRGLTGLKERVRMLDGDLVAAARPHGGFSVRALIPSRNTTVPSGNATHAPKDATVSSGNKTHPSRNASVPSGSPAVPSRNATNPSRNAAVPSGNAT
ncbi:histidine kinase [Sphaerisporangium corydalis]|uniref:histidine kinase n=1 Tax=Sphaerisporangium corydalis TaxID=1441875 RepID=A0ABV9ESP1_9ACTN|nr:histidine kinase [Sphaerisporangium corydalis]